MLEQYLIIWMFYEIPRYWWHIIGILLFYLTPMKLAFSTGTRLHLVYYLCTIVHLLLTIIGVVDGSRRVFVDTQAQKIRTRVVTHDIQKLLGLHLILQVDISI